ncbi:MULTISPECIES: lysozyme [unclassified Acinetobacter]|uniref:lysozyme n=1 Tax=unclassified Acinetobacter TaxID=196816 RepID=UPI0029346800|nr:MULTISPECIES: lysozyme [unclassified Acinetobacter]WOE33064.1 lysozyme [Acinetobacter sp. SAAs470]WOE37745.1 lysozyme [Acinetobacter sp. SAAs474]
MQKIFDFLRKISGGKLTQKQVDAVDKRIAFDRKILQDMLNLNTMITSDQGIALICSFEGKRLQAYDDGVGIWTIGFGTTIYPNGQKVKKGDTCTEAQAKQYMRNDLKVFEQTVNDAVTIVLTQNQFDALVSLTYNIGSGAFKNSTLLKKLNAGDIKGAANQFDVWVNAGGKRLQGLVNRRAKEKELFLK